MTNTIAKTGQQIVLTPDNQVEIREFDIRPPQSNEVLIETTRTLISAGTELGTAEQDRRADVTPGYANVGRIAALGAAVQDYQIGDRVLSLGAHTSHAISSTLPHRLRPVPSEVTKCPIHAMSVFPWTQQHNREQALAMIADGRLDLAPLISHRMPYTRAAEAYRLLRNQPDQALGVILMWGD